MANLAQTQAGGVAGHEEGAILGRGTSRGLLAQSSLHQSVASVQAGQVLFKKLADDQPTVPKYRIELMYSYTSGADALRRLDRRDEAQAACRAAIAQAKVLVRDQPTIT